MKSTNLKIRIILPLVLCGIGASWCPGAVTYVNPADITIPFTFGGVYLDLVTGNQGTPGAGAPVIEDDSYGISFGEPSGDWDLNLYFGGALLIHNTTFQPYREDPLDNRSAAHNVGLGQVVDGVTALPGGGLPGSSGIGVSGTTADGGLDGNPTPTHMGGGGNQFVSGTPGYLAFVLDPGSTSPQYGWIEVTLEDDGDAGTIHRWAYSPDPIEIGQIPEPGALVLMALGSLGVFRRRR